MYVKRHSEGPQSDGSIEAWLHHTMTIGGAALGRYGELPEGPLNPFGETFEPCKTPYIYLSSEGMVELLLEGFASGGLCTMFTSK